MNLHIVSDSKFSNTFFKNLQELGLLGKNKFVVQSNQKSLSHITFDIPFARLYSKKFSQEIGDTNQYEKVFIHQFSPLMYRWVATNKFRELNWMIWGGDLYNLPFVSHNFYEPKTNEYIRRHKSGNNFLYLLKVYLGNMPFRKIAYAKVKRILTWMHSEYEFASKNIPSLDGKHEFFFYENQSPYQDLDQYTKPNTVKKERFRIIVGNSGTPTNNHLDAIQRIADSGLPADLIIPVGYGESSYIDFLKTNVSFYNQGSVEFVDRFIEFAEYVDLLNSADALVMNHIRPQGYGNIFMMMYLGKPVFLNENNISLSDLNQAGLKWSSLKNFGMLPQMPMYDSREKILTLLSHDRLGSIYKRLFS
jgi:dTDP-N-acetylfucosamine:lipid II N-acetylfucosaminyltransferase